MEHRSPEPLLISAIVPIAGFPNGIYQMESWIGDPALSNFEVILVIDSEEDQTYDETQRIVQALKGLTTVRVLTSTARNPGGTRNLGLSSASGNWVVFWDCDDTPNPSRFLKMIKQAVQAKADIAIGEYAIQTRVTRLEKTLGNTSTENLLETIALNPGIWRFAFKSELAKKFNFYDMRMAEDQVYLVSLLETKPDLYIFKEHVYTYWRYQGNQLTTSGSALNQIVVALDIFIGKYKRKQCTPLLMVIIRLTLSALKKGRIQVKIEAIARLLYVSLRYPKNLPSLLRLFRRILDSK
jgi:glycosyltransferase involved in cell wall biosynthesis